MDKHTRVVIWATSPDNAKLAASVKSPEQLWNYVTFTVKAVNDQMDNYGWIRMGECDLSSVSIKGQEEILQGMIDAIEREQQQVRAQAEVKWQQLEETKQSLLALPHIPSEED